MVQRSSCLGMLVYWQQLRIQMRLPEDRLKAASKRAGEIVSQICVLVRGCLRRAEVARDGLAVLEEQRGSDQKAESRPGGKRLETAEIGDRHNSAPSPARATSSGRPRGRCPVVSVEMTG